MSDPRPRGRKLLVWLTLLVLAFGGGAGWQFTKAQAARAETREAQRMLAERESELAIQRTEGLLAAATIAAQLGSYERSRQFASEFFTMAQARDADVSEETRRGLAQILESRDATITSLSRADANAALDLARLFVRYRRVTGGDPGIFDITPADTSRAESSH